MSRPIHLHCVMTALLVIGITLLPVGVQAYSFTPAQKIKAQQIIDKGLVDKRGYQIVESLTTEVGPRLAGSQAEARAREWAVSTLEQLDFDRIKEEPFILPFWQRGIERAEVLAPFPQPLVVTALGGSVSTGPDGVEGQVVVFNAIEALGLVDDNGLKGAIVFINDTMARTQDGSGYGAAVAKRRLTAYEAHRVGAIGALIRSVGTSTHRFAHTGQMRRVTDDAAPSVPTVALAAADADQLMRMLAKDNNVRLRLTVTTETRPSAASGNIVADIVGRERPDEIVLVGAHLDSWDLGTGAIDDGAGVAIVLAATKLVTEALPEGPRRTIRVVLFGSEEVGLVGAQRYAEKHKATLAQHVAIAESDFGAGVVWRLGSLNVQESKLGGVTALQGELKRLNVVPGDNESYGGPDLKFMKAEGVPVIELKQDGTDYFDYHHTADDTLDKISIETLQQNIAAWAAFIYLVANTDIDFR
ncbi:M20/M25/M40 family metallo-hydrolase [Teredinibacter purpureus]|uniref:M20/M25/M40 family metallo-hydrolase n=1 Tax=Teredinibacter purpureus TaxID=2731756 RepID=UPI000AF5CF81|nr:M20/M25/M40 family metallo-hydrolase [Teredinibacter purpureus]